MSYYRVCAHCGAHLDPGEICLDCEKKPPMEREAPRTAIQPTGLKNDTSIVRGKNENVKW